MRDHHDRAPASGRSEPRRWRRLNQISTRLSLPDARFRPDAGALAVPAFRRFWLSMIVSNVGSWMQMVAQGWLILQLTDSPFYLGLVGLVRSVPALSLTLIGGVLADRLDRRAILLFTQSSAAILALALGVLDLTGTVQIWHVLLIAFFSSLVMALDNPTRQAMVPDLVGKDNVASAVGLNSAAWNTAAVVGPSIAGVLVALVSTAGAFLINGISYLAVIYAVWTMAPQPPRARSNQGIIQNLVEGLRYIAADSRIWGLMLVLAIATFFGRPYAQLMPVFARDVLGAGPSGYGVLMTATGIGALLGALSIGVISRSSGKGRLQLAANAVFGMSLLLFAASRWLALSLVLLLIIGAAQTLAMALTNTLLQLEVPEAMRGRVMSAYTLIPMGFMPLGSMALGSIGELVTVPVALMGAATIVIAGVVVIGLLVPAVRQIR